MSAVRRAPAMLGVGLVWLYRLTFGALFPTTCKYHPSCSEYAMQARAPTRAREGQPHGRLAPAPVQPVESRRLRPGPMMLFAIPIISQLEDVMKHVLNFFHTNVGLPWAWAIVATTVLVRMILVPLTIKQIHSMQNLQRFAPQMKEIQKKYKHDKQKQNEELMKFYRENNINPAASCLPMLLQLPVFISLYYTLKHFDSNFGRTAQRSLVAPPHPEHHGRHDGVLGRLRAARRLRREPDGVVALHDDDRRQDAADPLHGHAAHLRLRHRALPGRPRSLLGDDEPLDGRAGAGHAAAGRADACADSRATQLANAAQGRRLERQRCEPRTADAEAGFVGLLAAAAPGAAQEEAHEPEMSETSADLTAEATGETVGEAKWAALRELERRHPGLDKAAVQFEVVAEGERGILGVGYEPARVVAHLPAEAAEAAAVAEL